MASPARNSLMSYALLAFERCWTICLAAHNGQLSGQFLLRLWLGGVALVAFCATVPFLVPDGGSRAMPSGAYCLLRFDSINVTMPVLVVLSFFLVVIGVCYAAVARKICIVGMRSIRGDNGDRTSSHFSRTTELMIAAKLLMLTVVYVVLWTPAVVMIVGQI